MKTSRSYIIKPHVSFWVFVWFSSLNLSAQTFKAAAVVGGNASQINGDLIAGFDKLGIHGGLKVIADLDERIEASIELLWSERGSSSKVRAFDPFKIKLNYVEIPIIAAYKDWLKDDYYKMRFETGLSYGRLIDGKINTAAGDLVLSEFKKTDISGLVGVTFYSQEQLGFSFRYTHSINLLVNNQLNPRFPRLRGYFLTFRILYIIS